MTAAIYIFSFIPSLAIYLSLSLGGHFSYLAVGITFIGISLIELITPSIDINPKESEAKVFDFILYLQIPIHLFLYYTFFTNLNLDLPLFVKIGMSLSMGLSCGLLGINVAHELGHRNGKLPEICAKFLLITALYYQFYIDHNRGHHRHVATPGDSAFAKLNLPVYKFWPKAIVGVLKSAYKIDKRSLYEGFLLELTFLSLIAIFFGIKVIPFVLLSCLFGVLLLETVNYVEHYGLKRNLLPNGRYEKVLVTHSWNSNHIIGRGIMFNLSRHSDHHHMVTRKYQNLKNDKSYPQLPTGYPGMILLALAPPIFFKIMNPLVDNL